MGLIDRVKAARANLIDRTLPQRVVFHHVPKCGGTSVGRALRMKYILSEETVLPQQSFAAYSAFAHATDREQALIDVLDLREQMFLYLLYKDVRCVSLHVRFSEAAYANFADSYKFITILRDPVDRFISHYMWNRAHREAAGYIAEELEAFLDTPRAARMGATYVEYFCGLPKAVDITTAPAIDAAIQNLARFAVVGRLDDLPKFGADLAMATGKRIKIGHENKMQQDSKARDARLTPEVMAKITALCAPDQAIWDAAFPATP